PRTMFSFTFGNVPSGLAGPATLATGMTPTPPSNPATRSRPRASNCPTKPRAINTTAVLIIMIARLSSMDDRAAGIRGVLSGRTGRREMRRRGSEASLFSELGTPEVRRFMWAPPPDAGAFAQFIDWAHAERATGKYICYGIVPRGETRGRRVRAAPAPARVRPRRA